MFVQVNDEKREGEREIVKESTKQEGSSCITAMFNAPAQSSNEAAEREEG